MKLIKLLDKIGRYTAAISLSLGSVLFIWTMCFPNFKLTLRLTELFVYYGFIWNALIVVLIISAAIVYSRFRMRLFKVLGRILLNIPIAIFYFIIALIIA
ncbi:hypothetical protein [Winogradskyella sp. A3E31]|uniref:hypothetical protein n=1 Tax=Winogradskyella sp. A3E31 TaxID=3349637 RepID=UPI00398B3418